MELYNSIVLVHTYIHLCHPKPDPSLFCCFLSPPLHLLAMLQASLVEPNSHPTPSPNQHARVNGHRPVTSTSPQPIQPIHTASVQAWLMGLCLRQELAAPPLFPPHQRTRTLLPSGASTCLISSLLSCLAKEALAR